MGNPPFSLLAAARRRGLPQIAHPMNPFCITRTSKVSIDSSRLMLCVFRLDRCTAKPPKLTAGRNTSIEATGPHHVEYRDFECGACRFDFCRGSPKSGLMLSPRTPIMVTAPLKMRVCPIYARHPVGVLPRGTGAITRKSENRALP